MRPNQKQAQVVSRSGGNFLITWRSSSSYSCWSDVEASKGNIIAAELIFLLVNDNTIFSKESEIVPTIKESLFNSEFEETSVVNTLDFILRLLSKVIISICVGIFNWDMTLSQSFVWITWWWRWLVSDFPHTKQQSDSHGQHWEQFFGVRRDLTCKLKYRGCIMSVTDALWLKMVEINDTTYWPILFLHDNHLTAPDKSFMCRYQLNDTTFKVFIELFLHCLSRILEC